MTKDEKQQFTFRITQANSTEMIVILYEMLLCYLKEAEEAVEKEDKAAFHEAVRKARGCMNELLQSLHHFEAAPLQEIEKVISPLKDAYAKIAPENKKGVVMKNSQTVYAGLTYGRGTLSENMADQGTNRGMYI